MKTAVYKYTPHSLNPNHDSLQVHDGVRVEIISGPWDSHFYKGMHTFLVKLPKVPGMPGAPIRCVYGGELTDIKGHTPVEGYKRDPEG